MTPTFRRGDSNDDGAVDTSDAVFVLIWLFEGGPAPGCIAVTNTNGDTDTDLSDVVYLLGYVFLRGPDPAQPFPDCGPMPDAEGLASETPPADCS